MASSQAGQQYCPFTSEGHLTAAAGPEDQDQREKTK
jgi:hypothetical protein